MPNDAERIKSLEGDMMDVKIRLSVAESNIKEMGRKLDNIAANTNKIIWLVVSAIVLAVINSLIKGGGF